MSAPSQKSWQARLDKKADELTARFVESISFDHRLAPFDIAGSIAHAEMLERVGLIDADDLAAIRDGLESIGRDIEAGRIEFDPTLEDIHMVVEHALIERIGEPGQRLHTGRSRNDQVALDMRLWCRDAIDDHLLPHIADLQRALVEMAERHADWVMPAYTHLQPAQPVAVAAYLLSFCHMFQRDAERLADARKRINLSPLGCGAVAGSTLPLDRQFVAERLGFDGLVDNSIDGTSDRDYLIEFVGALAIAAMHLSRLAEDWILFNSREFGMLRIDDAFCTSSSMMLQKRNTDLLELVRGKSAGVIAHHQALLVMMKGLPLSYNRDMQEDKRHLFDAFDVTTACLEVVAAIAANSRFVKENLDRSLVGGFLDATALAEYLVGKGVPFRRAHQIVGGLVAECENRGLTELSELTPDQFHAACDAIGSDVFEHLGPENVVRRYQTSGSGGLHQASRQLANWRQRLERNEPKAQG